MPSLLISLICVFLILIKSRLGDSVLVEKGHTITLSCTVPNNIPEVTWWLNTDITMNISTCNLITNNCTDNRPSSYNAVCANEGSNKLITLTVVSARWNETEFVCTANNVRENVTALEVYAWPLTPRCYATYTNTYMAVNCTTANVFPALEASFGIEQTDLNRSIAGFTSDCQIAPIGSGSEGDCFAWCVYRIPMTILAPSRAFYVLMSARYNNKTLSTKPPSRSQPTNTILRVPRVSVINCPVGPGVQNGFIKIGTDANCTCQLQDAGYPPGFPRWFTPSYKTVGTEDVSGKFSKLTISYNASDPKPKYECWPISVMTNAEVYVYTISPKFNGGNIVAVTQPLIFVLGVLFTALISYIG